MDRLKVILTINRNISKVFKITKDENKITIFLFGKKIEIRKKSKNYECLQRQIYDLENRINDLNQENKLFRVILKRSIDITKIPPATGNLRTVQKIRTKILELVAFILNRNNIDFWLDYGTLIGAIRHHGFIPWDDDLDISLLREDALRLPEIFKPLTEFNKDFKFSNESYDHVLPRIFYKDFSIDIFSFEYIDKNYKKEFEKTF